MGVTIVSSPVKKLSPWNLFDRTHRAVAATVERTPTRVSHVFLSREKLSPVKFMLVAAATATGVPYVSSPIRKFLPWKFTVVTSCVLLTHNLLAIAKFLVSFGLMVLTNHMCVFQFVMWQLWIIYIDCLILLFGPPSHATVSSVSIISVSLNDVLLLRLQKPVWLYCYFDCCVT